MKIEISSSNLMLLVLAATGVVFAAGCAEMQSGNTTSLMSAAGFIARTPQTVQQKQIYAALPPVFPTSLAPTTPWPGTE